jgi:MSHA biogenesis protein MshL
MIDPDVTGEITVDFSRGTLRQALAAVVEPGGFHIEETPAGIAVRRLKTVLYVIDYPQLTRSGSGSASITLGGANSGGNGNGFVWDDAGQSPNGPGLNGAGSDATQVSISQENQNTFWNGLEGELRAMLQDGDRLVLNKFSGVAQVTAIAARHEVIRQFLELVNRRITSQVEIEARLVEVSLRNEQTLGVDWDLAGASLGGGVSLDASTALPVNGVGGTLLGSNTFTANLGFRTRPRSSTRSSSRARSRRWPSLACGP